MTMIAPLPSEALLGLHLGGTPALAELEARIAQAAGTVTMELNQLAEPSTIAAIERSAANGTRFRLLADARVPWGGFEDQLRGAAQLQGGRYRVYGPSDESWQHAKTFHFDAPGGGTETWLGNLAPIPKAHDRTELTLVLGGDAAAAARAVTEATIDGAPPQAVADAIDAAGRYGVLFNDPVAGRGPISEQVRRVLADDTGADLLVVTKGIQHDRSTSALIDAHRAGRDMQVYVRDIARRDAERLADANVPVWQVSGGLQPRVNAFFAGDRGIATTSFLWGNMLDAPRVATSRDAGVLFDGAVGANVRAAARSTIDAMPVRTSLRELVERGGLPETI